MTPWLRDGTRGVTPLRSVAGEWEKMKLKQWVKSSDHLAATARPVYRRLKGSKLGRRMTRQQIAMAYYRPKLKMIRQWAPLLTESDNFYYALTHKNRRDLSSLVAVITGADPIVIDGYLSELQEDTALRVHIEEAWASDPRMRDARLGFGRREGWYAFVRALKPRVVVETGVHHGVGSCLLVSALMRNAEEGVQGRYIGTEIDPDAGTLFTGPYREFGEILYGDSIQSLSGFKQQIDVFINDSDHSSDYERLEYQTVAPMLGGQSLILGDNSHVTSELERFARSTGRPFVFFREEPDSHWYPGAGIGISPSCVPLT